MRQKPVSGTLAEDLVGDLDAIAEITSRSRSNLIGLYILEGLTRDQPHHREAIAAIRKRKRSKVERWAQVERREEREARAGGSGDA